MTSLTVNPLPFFARPSPSRVHIDSFFLPTPSVISPPATGKLPSLQCLPLYIPINPPHGVQPLLQVQFFLFSSITILLMHLLYFFYLLYCCIESKIAFLRYLWAVFLMGVVAIELL